MKYLYCLLLTSASFILFSASAFAQTSWTGTTSVNWATASNWTAGVPTATSDATIGDANFTGAFQPTISATATCKSLFIGGSATAILTVSKTLTAKGDITINSNGSLVNGAASVSLTGNWTNNGSYTTTSTSATVIFAGLAQTLGGGAVTTFRKLTINAGSTVSLNQSVVSAGASGIITVSGTLNPNESPSYQVTTDNLTVNSSAVLKITAATFGGNYSVATAVLLNSGSIAEYSATALDQTVSSSYTYSTLRISGAGTKSLAADLPLLRSTSSSVGNIYVLSGTFNLANFAANRGTTLAGGTFSVSNGATVKIGGSNTLSSGYTTYTFSLTSTLEYNGSNQAVAAKTYGNLTLSSSSGSVVKTMPATAFTVAGNFMSAVGNGTAVAFTAGANITITGSVTIGAATSFDGSSFTHTVSGNWTNNGTYTGSTSTVYLKGANALISGSGAHNFNNLTVAASGISASPAINLSLTGNLTTTGSGAFSHPSPGILTMSGTAKTITGTGITLNELTITGSITTTSALTLTGNLSVTNSFSATSGTLTLTGSGKTISGSGTISLKALLVSGTISTASNFSISTSLTVTGSLTASAGTATFTSTATVTGTANLYNVTENGTSLVLASNAVLGIANTFAFTAGSLNVTTNIPNTVTYNGSVAQSVSARPYNNLVLSNGNTKTAAGAITINNALSIATGTTFNAGSYTHTLSGDLVNNGTLTAATSTMQFTGTANTTISGATTFNNVTINKTATTNSVSLLSNITVATITMTNGSLLTGLNAVTITATRAGNGIILGTITRTHSFTTGTAYAFEGPYNTILFTALSGVTSVTVSVAAASVADFPYGGAINRYYTINVPAGTYTATLRLHYEDAELSGNDEAIMQLWKYNGAAWAVSGKTTNSTTSNYVENSGITNLTNRWSCTDDGSVLSWNGSVDSDWSNGANWSLVQGTFSGAPTANDIAQIGTASFTNQPSIASAVTVKGIQFGSAQAATLTLASGSLITNGNISGVWSSNTTHTINAGAQNITVNGDLVLSDATAGHAIDFSIATGTVSVTGSVVEAGGANLTFTGAGILNIGKDFLYTNGTFTSGTGTIKYNGATSQTVAGVSYYHLTISKTAGIASLSNNTTIAGNLSVTSGQFNVTNALTVAGSVSVNAGATLDASSVTINVGGNWTKGGTFNPGTGTVNFNGTGAQTISAGSFTNFIINKASGTATLTGNVSINGNTGLAAGTLDLATFTLNHSAPGGTLTIADGAVLLVPGAANFPVNYTTYSLSVNSLVHYNGTVAQSIEGIHYGSLSFSNGASAKTFSADALVDGDLTINSGATVNASGFTTTLNGNWINNGTFIPGSGEIILNGAGKTVSGNTEFNDVTVNGSYTVAGSDITYDGLLAVTASGSYASGNGTATVNGDLTNSGVLTSSGTTTFSGTALQTIRLINALVSTSTGIVNFNGTVAPVLNSTSTPTFATLNINNTAGISPSVGWTVLGPFNISSGAAFIGGVSTHTISHNFTNNGTVTSSGTLNFNPATNVVLQLNGTTFSSTGTVIFGGSGQVTLTGTPTALQDVVIANTNSAGVVPPTDWTVNGKFSINNNAVFHAGSRTYTIGDDIESNGTLEGEASTFIMTSGTGNVTGSPTTTFNHFTVTGNVTANSDFSVAGDFTNNGTFDGSIGAVNMTGTANAFIKGTTSPSTIAQLTINKTGATVTAAVNISSVTNLNIAAGTFFTSTYSVTQQAGGGILIIMPAATLKLGGTNTLPAFSGYGLDEQSIVDYAGTTQTVSNSAIYGHLRISAAGSKTAANFLPLTVMGDFTLTAGNFIAGNNTHKLAGNWIMTGGTFNATASTIMLNGTTNQDINTLAPFTNLTINKGAGLTTLSSNVTVTSALALTLGKIDIGNNLLSIASGGTITGASAAKYIIATGSGTLIQQVTNGSSKVFPVGTSAAYTPATIALTAGSVTDNFTIRMLPNVYTQGETGSILTSGVVNATWVINEAVSGGSNATVTLQWPASLELPGFQRAFCMHERYTGAAWDYGGMELAASGSNPYTVSRSGFTAFTDFALAVQDVLPVKWLTISGRTENKTNHIFWSTADERNNSYFTIETSANGLDFSETGRVAAITGNSTHQYDFVHRNFTSPVNFYRIKQVDVDGRFSYSPVIKLAGQSVSPNLSIAPNPFITRGTILIGAEQNKELVLTIFEAGGRLVQQQRVQLRAGANSIPLDLSKESAGAYFIIVKEEGKSPQSIKLVKY